MNPYQRIVDAGERALRISEPFMRQAQASVEMGAVFSPVDLGRTVRMMMQIGGIRGQCEYGPSRSRSIEELALEIDALELAGHPQAASLQRWLLDWKSRSAS